MRKVLATQKAQRVASKIAGGFRKKRKEIVAKKSKTMARGWRAACRQPCTKCTVHAHDHTDAARKNTLRRDYSYNMFLGCHLEAVNWIPGR